MERNCLDIGAVQAFLDCEVSHEESSRISAHIATCDACALMLAEAEEESALVFSALEREMDTLVPTQRLWNRINDSIAVEKANMPWWEKAWAYLRIGLISPSLTMAASLLIVVSVFVIVMVNRAPAPDVAYTPPTHTAQTTSPAPLNVTPPSPSLTTGSADVAATDGLRSLPKAQTASYRPEPRRPEVVQASYRPSSEYIPGEDSYVATISTLQVSVDPKKDELLSASERVAYERDMAVVNNSINRLKKEIKRNPRNATAKQILYSSYQNKIDLLNSVAQKEELIANID
jgi:hypothetical protein